MKERKYITFRTTPATNQIVDALGEFWGENRSQVIIRALTIVHSQLTFEGNKENDGEDK